MSSLWWIIGLAIIGSIIYSLMPREKTGGVEGEPEGKVRVTDEEFGEDMNTQFKQGQKSRNLSREGGLNSGLDLSLDKTKGETDTTTPKITPSGGFAYGGENQDLRNNLAGNGNKRGTDLKVGKDDEEYAGEYNLSHSTEGIGVTDGPEGVSEENLDYNNPNHVEKNATVSEEGGVSLTVYDQVDEEFANSDGFANSEEISADVDSTTAVDVNALGDEEKRYEDDLTIQNTPVANRINQSLEMIGITDPDDEVNDDEIVEDDEDASEDTEDQTYMNGVQVIKETRSGFNKSEKH